MIPKGFVKRACFIFINKQYKLTQKNWTTFGKWSSTAVEN